MRYAECRYHMSVTIASVPYVDVLYSTKKTIRLPNVGCNVSDDTIKGKNVRGAYCAAVKI